jgi:hypothetical protein
LRSTGSERSGGFEDDDKKGKKIRSDSLLFILAGCVRVSRMLVNRWALIG